MMTGAGSGSAVADGVGSEGCLGVCCTGVGCTGVGGAVVGGVTVDGADGGVSLAVPVGVSVMGAGVPDAQEVAVWPTRVAAAPTPWSGLQAVVAATRATRPPSTR